MKSFLKTSATLIAVLAGLLLTVPNLSLSGGYLPLSKDTLEDAAFLAIVAYALHHLHHELVDLFKRWKTKNKKRGVDFLTFAFVTFAASGPLLFYTVKGHEFSVILT